LRQYRLKETKRAFVSIFKSSGLSVKGICGGVIVVVKLVKGFGSALHRIVKWASVGALRRYKSRKP
jgi:hypothetical protein